MIGPSNGLALGDFYRENRHILRENRTFTDREGSYTSKGMNLSIANLNYQIGENAEASGAPSSGGVTQIQYSSFQAAVNKSPEGGFSFSVSIIQATMTIERSAPQVVEPADDGDAALIEDAIEVSEDDIALSEDDLEEIATEIADEGSENVVASGAANAAYAFARDGEAALKILEGIGETDEQTYLI